ncbi:MAG TPA: translation initiation factor IF-3, partial [Candidatus Paceibacterota bacterium]
MIQRPRVNHEIRAAELRIISPTGENLGIKSLREALELTHGYGLDL